MKKLILGAIAALFSMVAAPVLAAEVTPPSHVQIDVLTIGELTGNKAPVTFRGKTMVVQLQDCEASWRTNDAFYVIMAPGTHPYVLHKALMDYAWKKSGEDWDIAFRAMVNANQVCRLAPVN